MKEEQLLMHQVRRVQENKILTDRINKAIRVLSIKQIRFIGEKDYIIDDTELEEVIKILSGCEE